MQFVPLSEDDLFQLSRSAETGFLENALLDSLLRTLHRTPDHLLPQSLGDIQVVAFFVYKLEYKGFALDILYFCLRWCLRADSDADLIASIIGNIGHILTAMGREYRTDAVLAAAIHGRFGHTELWTTDNQAVLEPTREIAEFDAQAAGAARIRFASGFRLSVSSGTAPLSRFRGWKKRLDPEVLNPIGKTVLANAFPLFGGNTVAEFTRHLHRLVEAGAPLSENDWDDFNRLKHFEGDGIEATVRRHRRFAGGDGLLSRGCYASVCKDGSGDDEGTMSRELMAYVDRRVPGLVYVGDSTHQQLNSILGHQVGVHPGYCATYVLLFPPGDDQGFDIFRTYYRELIGSDDTRQPRAFAFETAVEWCEIDDVLDLRLPETQAWFFDHFRNGDGHFLRKPGGTAQHFYDMVPTLMHPTLGGVTATHAMGSWLRSSGINALVFPSARSDVSVTMEGGKLADFHDWNLLDYRSLPVAATETAVDPRGWPDFVDPEVKLATIVGGPNAGTWSVMGIETRYSTLRSQIEGEEPTDEAVVSGPRWVASSYPRAWWLERPGTRGSAVEIRCPRCGWEAEWMVRDEFPPSQCPRCGYHEPETEELPDIGPTS